MDFLWDIANENNPVAGGQIIFFYGFKFPVFLSGKCKAEITFPRDKFGLDPLDDFRKISVVK